VQGSSQIVTTNKLTPNFLQAGCPSCRPTNSVKALKGNLVRYTQFAPLKGSVKEPNILIYFFFPPITQSCSVSDVLFTGGRGVSDFSVLKYY